MVRLLLALVLLSCSNQNRDSAGSGSGSAPPTAATLAAMSDDGVVDAALKSMAQIARLAKKHSSDCETLAKELAIHAEKNKDVITAFKKLTADETKQKEVAQRYGGQILAMGQETVQALQPCANHPAVKQLFETLNK